MVMRRFSSPCGAQAILMLLCSAARVAGQEATPQSSEPPHLRDRGTGVATSMFGTYVRNGEWLFYPFME
ncbi:MAG TPA: hypothetical protein VGF24_25470 [Vicinamibacterales bacterium]|jgi:hypothetical protein